MDDAEAAAQRYEDAKFNFDSGYLEGRLHALLTLMLDPLAESPVRVAAISKLQAECQVLLDAAVRSAREEGFSWPEISRHLFKVVDGEPRAGVSHQAARKRFRHHASAKPTGRSERDDYDWSWTPR